MKFTKKILLPLTLSLFMNPTFANTDNFQQLQKIAQQGHAGAQHDLGMMYA